MKTQRSSDRESTLRKPHDLVRPAKGGFGGIEFGRFKVKSFTGAPGDHLVCRSWNANTEVEGTVDVLVAKAEPLRMSGYHARTINTVAYTYASPVAREATKSGISEDQVPTRPYYVDCIILAVKGIRGGTGVQTPGSEGYIQWEEVSARDWAAVAAATQMTSAAAAGIQVGNVQHNLAAERDPTSGDDSDDGYSVTSLWANVATNTFWGCVDDALNAAVWVELTGGGGGAISDNPYDASWDGATAVAPSKNAVYDKIESLGAAGAPSTAEYVVKTADPGLSAERVLTDVARSGIKEDWGTAGQLKLTITSVPFIVNATSGGTVSGKTYIDGASTSPANKVLNAFTSDNDSVTITVEVDAGPIGGVGSGWQPAVTVYGGSAPVAITNLAPIVGSTRRFSGTAVINATASGAIYAETDDGGLSQSVTYTRALDPPTILTAIFAAQASGIYPGSQTQFKATDTMRITGTAQAHATRVFIKNAGISDALQGPFTVTAGAFDFTATVGTRASATQTGTLYADTGSGTTAGADFNTTNTADQDQTSPLFSAATITDYNGASGQEALKDSETAVVGITHTNPAAGDTYLYDNMATYELSIPSNTLYAATKTVTRIAGNYRETGTNYRLVATRTTKNGKAAGATATVKIAHTLPVITITDGANAARSVGPPTVGRMGTDNGTVGYADWTVKIRSNQTVLQAHAATLSAPKGTWQGSWVKSGTAGAELDYTRALRVANADLLAGGQAANNYTWGACSVKNRAGKEATVVTTNTTYALGGFQTRTLTQPAAPVHQIAIGCRAVNTAKLIAVNTSKGGSPTQAFEANITEHNNANPALNDYFTISNGSDVYQADGSTYHNSDKLFSDSNSSGTAQISLQETA